MGVKGLKQNVKSVKQLFQIIDWRFTPNFGSRGHENLYML